MTRNEAILKITDYLREHVVDPKTKTIVEAAFDGDSPMRGALLMLEVLGLVKFEDTTFEPFNVDTTFEPFNVRSSIRPLPLPDQTALEALETMHKIADQLMAELIVLHGEQERTKLPHDKREYWRPSTQPWWPDFARATETMKRLKGDT